RGPGGSSADLTQRDLPAPTVRAVIAAVEDVAAFGDRCAREARRLRLTDPTHLSVVGDGAGGIWNLAGGRFNGCGPLVDSYHALEDLAEVGGAAVGEGDALAAWLVAARGKLLGDGYAGVCDVVATPVADADAQARVSVVTGPVLNYFATHRERLGYAARL